VVCNTRVDTHFSTVEPSIRAGKAVFVEWPLAENYKRAVELAGDQRYENNIIGLQTPFSPVLLQLKDVLDSGRIGRVLSSDVCAFSSILPRDTLPGGLSYFADREIGGNPITIGYAHMVDFVHHLLGEFVSFESRMQIQRPTVKIVDQSGSQSNTITSNVPDFLTVHGKLAKGRTEIASDATLGITWRSGQPFKGAPGFVWTINGEKGELKVTSQAGPYLQLDPHGQAITIELHDFAIDEVIEIKWDWKDWQKSLPWASRIVGEVYERYARWVESGKVTSELIGENKFPQFHEALVRMKELDLLFENYDAQ